MKQEIEIEFKNLLTKEEFELLKKSFSLTEQDFPLQRNDYFDTPAFDLKQLGAALRIREKQGTYTLTLKQPHPQGLLETHQRLTADEALMMIETSIIIDGDVKEVIQSLGVDTSMLVHLGTLSTRRAEMKDETGLLVLDHSTYLAEEDYELEYEVKDATKGKQAFLNHLKRFNIPVRQTDNKIKRFFQAKSKQGR